MSTSVPRLCYGKLAGVHIRLWGDLDDTGVALSGLVNQRLWRVHERLFDGTWHEVLKRSFNNEATLDHVAFELGIKLYNA
jgi:hypothetical protein